MNLHKVTLNFLLYFYRHPDLNLKLLLNRYITTHSIREKKTFSRIIYGIIRNDSFLQFLIHKYAKTKKLENRVVILLKIGLFQLLFSRSVPDYSVVNEIVKLAKNKAKGFINALLRNVVDHKSSIISNMQDKEFFLSRRFINPLLLKNLSLISNNLLADLEYLYSEPVFHIKPNLYKINLKTLIEYCDNHQIPYRPIPDFNTLEIKSFHPLISNLLKTNTAYLQNISSQIICDIILLYAENSILDLCSAPGSKLITLHQKNPELTLFANDLQFKRIKLGKNSYPDFFSKKPNFVVSDGLKPVFKDKFPLILLDSPCSSSGTIRKNPDINLKINSRIIEKNSQVQSSLLNSLISHFFESKIIYAVCSFIKEETEDIIEQINHSDIRIDFKGITKLLKDLNFSFREGKYGCYLLPNPQFNNDIFYLSVIEKKKNF